MAGQRTQLNEMVQGTQGGTGDTIDGARTSTAAYRPTAATQNADASGGLQSLGQSLGAFFGNATNALGQVDQIVTQNEVVHTERENQALQVQGAIDWKNGKVMDPQYADRQAYAASFQGAAAENHAFELTEGLKDQLKNMPQDGSADPMKIAMDYYKSQVGQGTGDRNFDGALLAHFTSQAQSLVSAADNVNFQNREQIATKNILDQYAGRLQYQNGTDMDKFVGDFLTSVLPVTRGNPVQADKLLLSMANSAVMNQEQALGLERALRTPGPDGSSWASRNATEFAALQEQNLKRVTEIKSIQANNAVQGILQQAMAFKADPNTTPQQWLGLYGQAMKVDWQHGVGADKFHPILAFAAEEAAKKKANINMAGYALDNHITGHDAAQQFGKGSIPDEQWEPAYAQRMDPSLLSPATGLPDPMASMQNSVGVAQYVVKASSANNVDLVPKSLSSKMFGALDGSDPVKAMYAVAGARATLASGWTDAQLNQVLTEQQRNVFHAVQNMGLDGQDLQSFLSKVNTDPTFLASMAKPVTRAGLAEQFGKGGSDTASFLGDLDKAVDKSLRSGADRQSYLWNSDVSKDPAFMNDVYATVRKQKYLMDAAGKQASLDDVMKVVGPQMAGKYLLIPGFGGALHPVANPFGNQGASWGSPLNKDGPSSVGMGFERRYSGVKMQNQYGITEDPQETFADDMKGLTHSLPGIAKDPTDIYPDKPTSDGLMQLRSRTQAGPLEYAPGSDASVFAFDDKMKEGVGNEKIPVDPQEAAIFFRNHLPPGVMAMQTGFAGPNGRGWQLYGYFRLKSNSAEAQNQQAAAEVGLNRRAIMSVPERAFVGNVGGDESKPFFGGRRGSARPDPGTSAVPGALSDAASAVKGAASSAADATVDAAKAVPRNLRWGQHVDNLKSFFQ